ncbi:tetratricopeptide repeat protein [Shewanella halifaxensis]|uniref:tetratricopeptide repeat protein n=1 Tax=Shewanella halifaxensis TaxID=271098 RepID=UPI000D5933EA|nr:tetratricopeptide repeat protein [Shewanella halifaxensis]
MKLSLSVWQPLLLLFVVFICYWGTTTVPFYLDDISSISDNIGLLSGTPSAIFEHYGLRTVGYLSFAINYQLSGLDLFGYHVINIVIHLCTVWFVWLFSRECCKALGQDDKWLPLFVAVIFACHPLQTQAVTYIVQRLASLAALFYMAALYFYMLARASHETSKVSLFSCLAVLAAGLAFFTKQNTVVLPLSLIMLEVFVLRSAWSRKGVYWCVGGVISLLLLGCLYKFSSQFDGFLHWVDTFTRETNHISRLAYFETQLRVVGVYIEKFFWPVDLQLEYAIPTADGSFSQITNYAWLHLLLLFIAFSLRNKLPLLTYGIFFYYTAHIVESSFIPIRDVAFEHRTYLPNFGLILAVVVLVSYVVSKLPLMKKPICIISIIAVISLIATTVNRNMLWADPVAFYQNELSISTNKSRVHNALGQLFMEQQKWDLAAEHFEQAVVLNDRSTDELQYYIGNYIAATKNAGQVGFAISLSKKYLPLMASNQAKKILLTNLGFMYFEQRNAMLALSAFEQVMAIDNRQPPNEANLGLGLTLWALKRHEQAKVYLERAVNNDPENEYAKTMLAKLISLGF